MRAIHSVFHNGRTILHSHQQDFHFFHILANICYFFFLLIVTILMGMMWYLIVVFIFILEAFYLFIVPGLCCSLWNLVPWPGIKPGPPALEEWSLGHWTTREVPVVLICISLMIRDAECLLYGYSYIYFEKLPTQILCPLKKIFLLLNCWSSLYLWDTNSIRYMICKHFLSFLRLPFFFVDFFLLCAEVFI